MQSPIIPPQKKTRMQALRVGKPVADLLKNHPIVQTICHCAERVLESLGYGLNENLYQKAMCVEFQQRGVPFESERTIVHTYKGMHIGIGRADFVVQNKVIVETKVLSGEMKEENVRQLHNYLLQLDLPLGILINFGKRNSPQLAIIVLCNVEFLQQMIRASPNTKVEKECVTSENGEQKKEEDTQVVKGNPDATNSERITSDKSLDASEWVGLSFKVPIHQAKRFTINNLLPGRRAAP